MEENIKEYTSRIPSEAWTEYIQPALRGIIWKQDAETPTTTKNKSAETGGYQESFHHTFTCKLLNLLLICQLISTEQKKKATLL